MWQFNYPVWSRRGVFSPPFVRKLATPSKRNPSLRGGRSFFHKRWQKDPPGLVFDFNGHGPSAQPGGVDLLRLMPDLAEPPGPLADRDLTLNPTKRHSRSERPDRDAAVLTQLPQAPFVVKGAKETMFSRPRVKARAYLLIPLFSLFKAKGGAQ